MAQTMKNRRVACAGCPWRRAAQAVEGLGVTTGEALVDWACHEDLINEPWDREADKRCHGAAAAAGLVPRRGPILTLEELNERHGSA